MIAAAIFAPHQVLKARQTMRERDCGDGLLAAVMIPAVFKAMAVMNGG